MLIFKDAKVVTGDSTTIYERATVIIENGVIAEVTERFSEPAEHDAKVIDGSGKVLVPGMINHHAHGVVNGPIFASAAEPLGMPKVIEQLDRNLLQGVTTVLNVDGFCTMDEVKETQRYHPINIKACTMHTPLNFTAADRLDAAGLRPEHRTMTVEKMLEQGAVAIGEIGGGHTLGGGGQDYIYIPRAIKKATGRDIDSFQARKLKLAVLGRFIEESACDIELVAAVLAEIGLDDCLTPEAAKQIVVNTVLPSVSVTLDGYREAANEAIRFNVPMIAHNAPTSMKVVHEIAAMGMKRFIAAHSNYLYTLEESIENTRKLKQYPGVIIDAAVHDCFGEKRLVSSPLNLLAFFKEDLADIVSTDYAAGKFDSMLLAFEEGIKLGKIGLAKAVGLGTKKVADAIPGLAPKRGLIEKGYVADLVLCGDPQISLVDTVTLAGTVVVQQGKRVA